MGAAEQLHRPQDYLLGIHQQAADNRKAAGKCHPAIHRSAGSHNNLRRNSPRDIHRYPTNDE